MGKPTCRMGTYHRKSDGSLERGIPCGRPITFRVIDEYYGEVYYTCEFHAGRKESCRTTVHAIELKTGECISCKCTVAGGICDHTEPVICESCGREIEKPW